ncbi:MAG: Abortive infection protein [Verrucomicrobiaceae bacterium]|nr:Abortive infection protein [Verrucomicrobiaceae bacterium]
MIESHIPQPPPLPPPLPVEGFRVWALLFFFVPMPLIFGLLGLGRQRSRHAALSDNWQQLLMVCAFEVVVFGAFFGLAVWLSKPTKDQLLLRYPRPWHLFLLGAGYSIGIRLSLAIMAGVVAATLILTHMTTLEEIQAFSTVNKPDIEAVVSIKALKNDPIYYWLTLTFVSFVVAGLREELWRATSIATLRRLWPSVFASRKGEYVAVVLTSIVFGIGHIPQGAIAVVGTAAIGVLLGCIMVFHRSIWPAVIAHGFFDATSFALLPLIAHKLQGSP